MFFCRFFLIALLLPLYIAFAAAPAKSPFRVEQELGEEAMHNIIPLGQLGVLVASNASVCFYDENLSMRWIAKFSISSNSRYVCFRMLDDSLHFVVNNNNKLYYMRLSLASGKGLASAVNVPIDNRTSVENAQIYNDRLLMLVSNNGNYRIIKKCYNSDTFFAKEIALPNDYICRSSFFDTAQNKVYALFRSENYREDAMLLAVCDTSLSDISLRKIAAPTDDIRIVDGLISQLVSGSGEIIVGGIWNYNNERQERNSSYEGTQSAGIYLAVCARDRVNISFKTYRDFKSSDSSLSESLAAALERTRKGDIPTLLAGLQVVPYKSGNGNMGVAVLAEAFERKFTTQTDMYYDVYGSMVPYTRTIYEGMYFVDVFCGMFEFGGVGEVSESSDVSDISDVYKVSEVSEVSDTNSSALGSAFKSSYYIFNVNMGDVYQNIFKYTAFAQDSSGAVLYAFPSEGRIYYRALPAMQGVSGGRLNAMYSGDRVQKNWNNRIIHWYDNCFLGYGYQEILNYKVSRSARNVLYMNKLLMGVR